MMQEKKQTLSNVTFYWPSIPKFQTPNPCSQARILYWGSQDPFKGDGGCYAVLVLLSVQTPTYPR